MISMPQIAASVFGNCGFIRCCKIRKSSTLKLWRVARTECFLQKCPNSYHKSTAQSLKENEPTNVIPNGWT